ncbi:hypothetical protein [Neobacillus drentensis]|uniref:hypothetical protein n=1 Tax=Neobacillus drentensis TaxID=220684 RepID=UPI002854C97B|nr:hypothetical protein [Neobacillus drentensis]MDR7237310.1 ribosomal protein L37AE/L43A [Neobacillus drentensis]
MSLEYFALSYFKEKKIRYYYEKPIITFPCPYCSSEAKMISTTTIWHCGECPEKGNLQTLITRPDPTEDTVYHPLKERKAIRQHVQRLSKKYGEDLSPLLERIDQLIEYHQNKEKTQV